jgi:hypothetical protein
VSWFWVPYCVVCEEGNLDVGFPENVCDVRCFPADVSEPCPFCGCVCFFFFFLVD